MSTTPITQFKGWTLPGPGVPGGEAPAADETLDALCGHFKIFQLKDGHRFSTDDIIVAWYGTLCAPSAARILDLGSGMSTVGMIAAWRLQGARLVTVEAQERSYQLAQKSLRFNGLTERVEAHLQDLREFASDERFDLVLSSPPYFPLGTGVTAEHPQKLACRFEVRGDIADYCAAASKHLAPGGVFVSVFPYEQDARVRGAAREAGLKIHRLRPVALKEGEAPLLALYAMVRQGDLPEKFAREPWIEPELTIRRKDGSIDPEYSCVKLTIGFPP